MGTRYLSDWIDWIGSSLPPLPLASPHPQPRPQLRRFTVFDLILAVREFRHGNQMNIMKRTHFVLLIVSHLVTPTAGDRNLVRDDALCVLELKHAEIADDAFKMVAVHVGTCQLHRLDHLIQMFSTIAVEITIPPSEILVQKFHDIPLMVAKVMEVWLVAQIFDGELMPKLGEELLSSVME